MLKEVFINSLYYHYFYRRAELCLVKGEYPVAGEHVHNVLDYCRQRSEQECICPSLRVRALILAAELQSCCTTTTCAPSGSISLLSTALALAQLHYLDYLAAVVGLHLANLQVNDSIYWEKYNFKFHTHVGPSINILWEKFIEFKITFCPVNYIICY